MSDKKESSSYSVKYKILKDESETEDNTELVAAERSQVIIESEVNLISTEKDQNLGELMEKLNIKTSQSESNTQAIEKCEIKIPEGKIRSQSLEKFSSASTGSPQKISGIEKETAATYSPNETCSESTMTEENISPDSKKNLKENSEKIQTSASNDNKLEIVDSKQLEEEDSSNDDKLDIVDSDSKLSNEDSSSVESLFGDVSEVESSETERCENERSETEHIRTVNKQLVDTVSEPPSAAYKNNSEQCVIHGVLPTIQNNPVFPCKNYEESNYETEALIQRSKEDPKAKRNELIMQKHMKDFFINNPIDDVLPDQKNSGAANSGEYKQFWVNNCPSLKDLLSSPVESTMQLPISLDETESDTSSSGEASSSGQASSIDIPKSTGAIPKSTGAIPKSTGAIPKSTGAIPKAGSSTDFLPKHIEVKCESAVSSRVITRTIPRDEKEFTLASLLATVQDIGDFSDSDVEIMESLAKNAPSLFPSNSPPKPIFVIAEDSSADSSTEDLTQTYVLPKSSLAVGYGTISKTSESRGSDNREEPLVGATASSHRATRDSNRPSRSANPRYSIIAETIPPKPEAEVVDLPCCDFPVQPGLSCDLNEIENTTFTPRRMPIFNVASHSSFRQPANQESLDVFGRRIAHKCMRMMKELLRLWKLLKAGNILGTPIIPLPEEPYIDPETGELDQEYAVFRINNKLTAYIVTMTRLVQKLGRFAINKNYDYNNIKDWIARIREIDSITKCFIRVREWFCGRVINPEFNNFGHTYRLLEIEGCLALLLGELLSDCNYIQARFERRPQNPEDPDSN